MANAGIHNLDRSNQNLKPNINQNPKDRTVEVEIPDFDGHSLNPEGYIEWEFNIDRYFEFKDTSPDSTN